MAANFPLMSEPEIVRGPLPHSHSHKPTVELRVDRLKLAKRRWRGLAEDGRDFGFDLETPLHDGDFVFETGSHRYQIRQTPEAVLELQFANGMSPAALALLGWNIGNLHFPVEIGTDCLRVADDPALRQLFEREHYQFVEVQRVFRPATSGAHHGHHHHH